MLDTAELVLRNDLYMASVVAFFLNLPPIRPYWEQSEPLHQQSQIIPLPAATVTQTVTEVLEPITLRSTKTIYDTVTKNVTSISTIVHEQLVTKRECLSTDRDAPRATLIQYSEAWASPSPTCARCVPCAPLPSLKPTVPVIPSPATWIVWFLLSLVVVVLGAIFLIFRLDLISKRVAEAERKSKNISLALEMEKKAHQTLKTKASEHSTKLEMNHREVYDLIDAVAKRNEMLKSLGVFENDDDTVDEDRLSQMVKERKSRLVTDARRIRRMEAENIAKSKRIKKLEADNTSAKEHVETLLKEMPTQEAKNKFQSSLDEKDREIKRWRDAFLNKDNGAAVKKAKRSCEEKEAELEQLRPLPAKIDELQQALSDASKQIDILQQAKKEQGVADRRRWNKEKEDLRKNQAKAIKALEEDLKGAKASLVRTESEDVMAKKKLLEELKAEKAELMMEAAKHQRQVKVVNETVSEVFQDSNTVREEREQLRTDLKNQENRHVAENTQLVKDFMAVRDGLVREGFGLQQQLQLMNESTPEIIHNLKKAMEGHNDGLIEECDYLKDERNNLMNERNDIMDERNDLIEECDKLRAALNELESKLASLNELKEERNDLIDERNALEEERDKFQAAFVELKSKCEIANEELMNVRQDQNELLMQAMAMRAQLDVVNEITTVVIEGSEDVREGCEDVERALEEADHDRQTNINKMLDMKAEQNKLQMEALNFRMQLHGVDELAAGVLRAIEENTGMHVKLRSKTLAEGDTETEEETETETETDEGTDADADGETDEDAEADGGMDVDVNAGSGSGSDADAEMEVESSVDSEATTEDEIETR